MFELGEIINPEDWGLRIQITSLNPLEATVIKNAKPTSYVGGFFPVGTTLHFVKSQNLDNSWRIESLVRDMPWFVLGIYDGRKRFEHYR